jgi:hypothetical protein
MQAAFPFELTDMPHRDATARSVELPRGIRSAAELLQAWYDHLELPGYFGFNWDALSDCLRDLHWVGERDVRVHHAELPALPEAELCTYLEVLAEAIASWVDGDAHRLHVSFPVSAEPQLRACLPCV